jgi:hypothetical protein
MPQFDPEVIQVMRSVLDDVMNKVPLEISGTRPIWLKLSLKRPRKVIPATTSY